MPYFSWSRSQSIRTLAEVELTFPLAEAEAPLCERLTAEAVRLRKLGFRFRRIAKALGADDKTVAKALARIGFVS